MILTLITVVAGVLLVSATTKSVLLLVLASVGGLALGLPIFWLYAYIFMLLWNLKNDSGKSFDFAPVKAAKQTFRESYPDQEIAWTRCTTEETRYVVGVFYGSTRPPRYIFYTIDKTDNSAAILQNDENYRPKQWR